MITRAFAVWTGLMVVAIANGALREAVLVPRLGAASAHVLSTSLLCLAILAIALGTIEWMVSGREAAGPEATGGRATGPEATGSRANGGRADSAEAAGSRVTGSRAAGPEATGGRATGPTRDALAIGAVWLVLVLAFEFGFGHFVGGKSWVELLHEYNVAAGRVWVAVPVVTMIAPWAAARVKGMS